MVLTYVRLCCCGRSDCIFPFYRFGLFDSDRRARIGDHGRWPPNLGKYREARVSSVWSTTPIIPLQINFAQEGLSARSDRKLAVTVPSFLKWDKFSDTTNANSRICAQGNLKGYDHTINLVLEGCSERIYSQARGVEQVGIVPSR